MISINLIDKDSACRLVFEGCLAFEVARELEDGILNALRRYTRFEVDLSGVSEIDLCGLHLLQILESVAGDSVETVGGSPIVEQARRRLLATQRGHWLRNSRKDPDYSERQVLAT